MSNIPKYWVRAKKNLSSKDKVMATLIKKYKSPNEKILTTRKDIFFHYAKVLLANK
jgi:DNA-3-methyladenine glycosylase II